MSDMTIWTKAFWMATLERALRTAAGALLALVTVAGFSPREAPWADILATVGVATLISVLLAIIGNGVSRNGPSFADSEQVMPPEPQPKGSEHVPERALREEDGLGD